MYWTIKSSIDLIGYGLGQTDKFQGTGVWKGVQFEREKKDEESTDAKKKDPVDTPK